jgi:hypothetical protein
VLRTYATRLVGFDRIGEDPFKELRGKKVVDLEDLSSFSVKELKTCIGDWTERTNDRASLMKVRTEACNPALSTSACIVRWTTPFAVHACVPQRAAGRAVLASSLCPTPEALAHPPKRPAPISLPQEALLQSASSRLRASQQLAAFVGMSRGMPHNHHTRRWHEQSHTLLQTESTR